MIEYAPALSVHLYPSFNEHFNPSTSTVLADYFSLLSESGKLTLVDFTVHDEKVVMTRKLLTIEQFRDDRARVSPQSIF